jgi:C-terminal processing protease CtpA/Prc
LLEVLERATQELGKQLRVLIGRSTFSAAMQLAVDIERRTPAQFVGEPTGGSPNHYGDAGQVVLTDSRLVAYVATLSWTTAGEGDERLMLEPDLPVPVRSADYFAGRDPVLEAALD